jgi:hypothetical protein
MNTTVRSILAVLGGLVVGSVVNMGLITVGGIAIPPPGGGDVTTFEGLRGSMHLFEPRHFLFPFLAHAVGTLAGASVAAAVAPAHKLRFAMAIGVFFLVGGAISVMMLPSPLWFDVVDLGAAYLPMAWLGARLVGAAS